MTSDEGPLDRLSWLERAIPETRDFCERVEADAETERMFARFGTSDYDFEIDLNHQAVLARETLAKMEDERGSIIARREMRAAKEADEERSRRDTR